MTLPSAGNKDHAPASTTLTTLAGRQFLLRPIRTGDADSYDRLVSTLSPEDRRYRFFSAFNELPDSLRESLINVDHSDHEAFVAAEDGASQETEICGVVRLIKEGANNGAEYAIIVSGQRRGLGLGYSLMQYAIDYARYVKLSYLRGEVLLENKAMMQMCRELGFKRASNPDDPAVATVTLHL